MTIDLITPHPRSNILAGTKLSFDVDATYTSMTIAVDTAAGFVTAYNSSTGPQSGFSVKVLTDGSTHTFTLGRDAGWDTNPLTIRVTENETGTSKITEYGYDLQANRPFPPPSRPYEPDVPPTLDLYSSGDQDEYFYDVEWIDTVGPPDGIDAIPQEALKVQLDATATTRDPDAIHGDGAGEIDAIADLGVAVGHAAILMLEDSEADHVKKKMLTDTFIAVKEPEKLTDDLGCQLLYTGDDPHGDGLFPINHGPAGEGGLFDLNHRYQSSDHIGYVPGRVLGTTMLNYHTTAQATLSDEDPRDDDVTASGDVTVQVVFRLYVSDCSRSPTFDIQLFRYQMWNGNYRRTSWCLGFDAQPQDGPYHLHPRFFYRTLGSDVTVPGTGTSYDLVASDIALMGVTDYHMVARRRSDGAGAYDNSIWVNGIKVAEELGQVAGVIPGGTAQQVKIGAFGTGTLLHALDCAKMSNIALTDAQIISEYKKALGIV